AGDLPLHHLMIETDCPFMLPDKQYLPDSLGIQDRKNEPAVRRAVAECLRVAPVLRSKVSREQKRAATSLSALTGFGAIERLTLTLVLAVFHLPELACITRASCCLVGVFLFSVAFTWSCWLPLLA
ncbi:unnamed protein product, partial [Polarella glacialis]